MDPPQAHEVRIRIVATSVCHTDLTILGLEQGLFPRILGHEAAGIVESVGEGVEEMQEGDHVVPLYTGECGQCSHCASPKTNLCLKYWTLMKTTAMLQPLHEKTRFSILKEEGTHQAIYPCFTSTFSEYTVLPVDCVAKISPDAPLDRACLFACGIPTGLGAAWNIAKVEKGSSVAIFGLGTIGLAVADGVRIAGASRIIGVDINPNKFDLAKKFGITEFINPNDYSEPIQKVLGELTSGGVDYSFECVGKVNLMAAALESTREGWGKTVITGMDTPEKQLCFSPYLLGGRSIESCIFGGFKGKMQVPHLVDRFLKKEVMADEYITHKLPFECINEAIDLLREGKSLRCIMFMAYQNSL